MSSARDLASVCVVHHRLVDFGNWLPAWWVLPRVRLCSGVPRQPASARGAIRRGCIQRGCGSRRWVVGGWVPGGAAVVPGAALRPDLRDLVLTEAATL